MQGAIFRRQRKDHTLGWVRYQLSGTSIDTDVLHHRECRQVYRRDGLAILIRYERVARETSGFFAGASTENRQPGSQKQTPVMH